MPGVEVDRDQILGPGSWLPSGMTGSHRRSRQLTAQTRGSPYADGMEAQWHQIHSLLCIKVSR